MSSSVSIDAPPVQHSLRRVGLASSALVVVLSLLLISPLPVATFNGVVSFVALCCIPVQMAIVTYLEARPGLFAGWTSARRGALLLAVNLALGGLAALGIHYVIADGWGMDFPGLPMFCIIAVVVGLWLTQVCQSWPFTAIANPLLRAVALLLATYLIAFAIYRIGFNFDAFGLPTDAALRSAPSGLFPAWHVLTFAVTAISGLFIAPAFRFAGLPQAQPLRALANTVLCLLWAAVLFGVGVGLLHLDVVSFLVWVPVPTLFGGLIVLKMCRGGFYPDRPAAPWANAGATLATAIALGAALVAVYQVVLTTVHPQVGFGGPMYTAEVWLAGATLAFTFPLLNVVADYFGFWPVERA
ncbi:MAG: hypothetical protein IPL41_04935 [Micropruina sp.]|nr:hypothetical protein [Micropruina sp.]